MKLKNFIIGAFTLVSFISFGQTDTDDELHCKRMKFLAQTARLEKKDFRESSIYMLKAEKSCNGLTAGEMAILIASLRNTIMDAADDPALGAAYTDTLLAAWDRAEKMGAYDKEDDLLRAYYLTQGDNANNKKADSLFQAGIKAKGSATQEHYVSYYYYNLFILYSKTTGEDQSGYKQRLIKEYFSLLKLVREAKMSVNAEENLNNYLNAVVQTCDDIAPELDSFLANVPEDKAAALSTIKNFISLLEKKKCTDADQYESLVKLWDELDPSLESKMAKAKLMMSKKKYSEAMKTFREINSMTEDDALKQEANYSIAYCQFKLKSYMSAYKTAMNVGGTFKGQGLSLAGQIVAKNNENCGVSTFERKANFYYAVELLERAKSHGESVGGLISSYKKQFPSSGEIFNNGDPATVTIDCYGVTVKVVK